MTTLEKLHQLTQTVINARGKFGAFQTHIGTVEAADTALFDFLLHELPAPYLAAMLEVCNRAAAYTHARREEERATTDGNSDDRRVANCRSVMHETALLHFSSRLAALDAKETPNAK
jgi:hypothetical protein